MRPKVVILILVVAFGLLGAVALIKGLGRHEGAPGEQASDASAGTNSTASATNAAGMQAGASGSTPAASEQLRAALISKDLEQIQELQGEVDGTNNPVIIAALLAKISSPEVEVRKAVLDTLKQLNDTNAIPGLQQTADAAKDPREKVAMLDVIDYLKTPGITDGVDPQYATNFPAVTSLPKEANMNPSFLHKTRKKDRLTTIQSQAAQNAPATPQQ